MTDLAPLRTKLAGAAADVEGAERALRAALQDGESTSGIRAYLANARADLAAAEADLAQAEAAEIAVAEAATKAEADALVDMVSMRLAELARCQVIPTRPGPTLLKEADAVQQAARDVVDTQKASDGAAEAHAVALDAEAAARDRLAAHLGDRAVIVARRAGGDRRDGDGAALSLLDADVEGCRGILTEAEAVTARCAAAAAATKAAFGAAQAALARVEADAAEAAEVQHAEALAAELARSRACMRAGTGAPSGLAAGNQLYQRLERSAVAVTAAGKAAKRGTSPLSCRTRRRLLAGILDRANSGDLEASATLIRLSAELQALRAGHRPASTVSMSDATAAQ